MGTALRPSCCARTVNPLLILMIRSRRSGNGSPGITRALLRPGGRAVQSAVATTPPLSVPKLELGPAELAYAARARSANTVKGYRSDWAEWTAWCASNGVDPMPADPIAMSKYLAELARHGAKVGTMSRRLSAIRFAEQAAGVTSRLDDGIVASVWEGIRRTHGAPPEQSLPIMPPLLCGPCSTRHHSCLNDGRPSLTGLRDHALLLVGFVGALRRSEIVAIDVEHLEPHEKGLVLHIPRSKVNQTGENDELVVLPASTVPGRCPVAAILAWRHAAGITTGPLLRGVTKGGTTRPSRMNDSSINLLVKAAVARARCRPGAVFGSRVACRFRDVRESHGPAGSFDSTPDTAPVGCLDRTVCAHTRRVAGKRCRRTTPLTSPRRPSHPAKRSS